MPTKDVLLKIVDELEELRAAQIVMSNRVPGLSPYQAADAMSVAKQTIASNYKPLRDEIEKLP
ncbi:hypothetical protein [Terracidiphilus gabretensis]|uniref:hypothetical protein n=1 Tax=Terracidiphilus gabretensis TaxID=1577687 RepID=UPI0012F77502|nr:hypothetical protein [Terracidiphilus gabretensis]